MSRQYFGDPIDAFNEYMEEEAEYESKCPVCCECDCPITDDYYFEIDGYFYCEDCLSNHKKSVDEYVREQEEI